jgi:hypothetical protein
MKFIENSFTAESCEDKNYRPRITILVIMFRPFAPTMLGGKYFSKKTINNIGGAIV